MLQVPLGTQNENKPSMGGCNCKRQKLKISNNFNGLEMLPSKVLVDNLRPLKDITSEKNKIVCYCANSRSKSTSGEGSSTVAGAFTSNQLLDSKRRCSTSTISDTSNHQPNIIFQQNIFIKGQIHAASTCQRATKTDLSRNKTKKEKQIKSTKTISTSTSSLTDKIYVDKAPKSASVCDSTKFDFNSVKNRKSVSTSTSSLDKGRHEKSSKSAEVLSSTKVSLGSNKSSQSKTPQPGKKLEIIAGHSCSSSTRCDAGSSQRRDSSGLMPRGTIRNADSRAITNITEYKSNETCPTFIKQSLTVGRSSTGLLKVKKEITYVQQMGSQSLPGQVLKSSQNNYEKWNSQSELGMCSGIDLANLSITDPNISQISLFSRQDSSSSSTGGASTSTKHTPILPNAYTGENVFLSKKPDRLREPKVKKRSFCNESRQTLNLTYVCDIYNEEYLYDIFEYLRHQERRSTLSNGFLKAHNPNYKCRSGIANWLLKIQAHLHFSEGEYYLAIYLLDRVLAQIHVPINMYQLLGMCTLWIATKFMGSNNIRASTLIHYSDGAYLTQQLVKMEQKVLKMMDFHITTLEPSVCIYYYLKIFNLEKNDLAKLSSFYILDSFSLTPAFSSTPTSILAAAAVRFTLNTYHERSQENVYDVFRNIFSSDEMKTIKSVESQLYGQLINMLDDNYIFKEPYKKYGGQSSTSKIVDVIQLK